MEIKRSDIPIFYDISEDKFDEEIHPKRFPAILRKVNVGPCITKWSAEYLASAVGERLVKIHVSENGQMNFLTKNFQYKTLPFNQLLKRAAQEEHKEFFLAKNEVYYLRSLGNDARGREVADFNAHYPELSQDFFIPTFLASETIFSSVLRVASRGVQLWTHYVFY